VIAPAEPAKLSSQAASTASSTVRFDIIFPSSSLQTKFASLLQVSRGVYPCGLAMRR
jgi:hypothetical protein